MDTEGGQKDSVEAVSDLEPDVGQGDGRESSTVNETNSEFGGDASQDGPVPSEPQPGLNESLGNVAWLMMQSPAHKHLFLTDLEWLVIPAMLHRQFRIYRKKGVPIAYASWASLTEEAEQRFLSGARKLAPGDWAAGNRLWLIDMADPFGNIDAVIKDLDQNVLKGRSVKTLIPDADGKGTYAVELGRLSDSE